MGWLERREKDEGKPFASKQASKQASKNRPQGTMRINQTVKRVGATESLVVAVTAANNRLTGAEEEKKRGHRARLAPSYLGTRIAAGGLNF
jgi:hypothetical protein